MSLNPNFDGLRQRIIGRTRIAVGRSAQPFQERLRSTSPKDSGQMASNTRVRSAGPNRLDIHIAVDYASYVREGTEPHEIRPRTRQMLAFFWDQAPDNLGVLPDGRVLARHVNHPGTDPDPWYDDAIRDLPDIVNTQMEAVQI